MKVSLPSLLFHDPRLLQKVILNVAPCGIPLEVKIDVHVFTKSTGVVIPIRLGVAKCLHDLVGPDQDSGHSGLIGLHINRKDDRNR